MLLSFEKPFVGAFAFRIPRATLPRRNGLLASQFERLLSELSVDAVLAEQLGYFVGIDPELLVHRLLHQSREALATFVTALHERVKGPPPVVERRMDASGVLAAHLNHFDCIPHDMVLAHGLEPECRDADRPLADLRRPREETGGERLPVDLGPAGGIDEKVEHVLLATVTASRHRFAKHTGSRLGRDAAQGVFADAGEIAELVETPIVQLECAVSAGRENESIILPREVSFKGALQTLAAYRPLVERASPAQMEQLYEDLLIAIASDRVGNRPNRYEPRAIKRRPKPHALLTVPRAEAKRLLAAGVTD
jgi:hypothetical protein